MPTDTRTCIRGKWPLCNQNWDLYLHHSGIRGENSFSHCLVANLTDAFLLLSPVHGKGMYLVGPRIETQWRIFGRMSTGMWLFLQCESGHTVLRAQTKLDDSSRAAVALGLYHRNLLLSIASLLRVRCVRHNTLQRLDSFWIAESSLDVCMHTDTYVQRYVKEFLTMDISAVHLYF